MKVLFIGHYRDGNSGWASASKNYILAMDKAGIDVVPASLKLNDTPPDLPDRILELESKSIKNCDVCIQHVLPHHLQYNGFFKKNIALCVYECYDAYGTDWPARINMMDELWTSSQFSKACFITAGVKIPIKIIPHAFDLSIYEQPLEKIEHPLIDGNVLFYTIADLNQRKNLAAFIRTFHITFTRNMPVSLLIKTSRHGMTGQECAKIVQEECLKIKKSLKLYRRTEDYHDEMIIADQIAEKELMHIHNSGHVYVCTSRGEAWCVPLFDAVGFNKITIAPKDMFDYPVTYEVPTFSTTVRGMNDTFFEIGSGREKWEDIDEIALSKAMMKAYEDVVNNHKPEPAKLDAYSYEVVGNLIKETLCQN